MTAHRFADLLSQIAKQINPEIGRGDLTDEQWKKLEPLLPPQKPKTGRPGHNHRQIINGILWILRTGAPWRDLPDCYGVHSTVSSRFYRWQKAGIWDEVWQKLQTIADFEGKIDWEVHMADSTVVRAHQHAAGAILGAAKSSIRAQCRGVFN